MSLFNVLLVLSLKALSFPSAGQSRDVSIQSITPYCQPCFVQQVSWTSSQLSRENGSPMFFFNTVLQTPLHQCVTSPSAGEGWCCACDFRMVSPFFWFFSLCPDIAFLPQLLFLCRSEVRALPYQLNTNSATTQDSGCPIRKLSWSPKIFHGNKKNFFTLQLIIDWKDWIFSLGLQSIQSGSQAVWFIWHSLRPQI